MKTIIYILVSLILNGFILSYILDIRLIDHDLIPIKEPPIMQEETSKLPEVEKIDQSGAPYENTVKVSALDSICMLVNKYSGLPEDYEPSDLVQVPSSGENENVCMRKEAAEAFEKLIGAASNEGFILNACSAYRSYAYQVGLFNKGAASYGEEYADRYWTRPGYRTPIRISRRYSYG